MSECGSSKRHRDGNPDVWIGEHGYVKGSSNRTYSWNGGKKKKTFSRENCQKQSKWRLRVEEESFSNAGNSEQEKIVENVNTNWTGAEQKVKQKRNKSKEKWCPNVKRATKICKINEVCGLQLKVVVIWDGGGGGTTNK